MGNSFTTTTASGNATEYGTRAGMELKCGSTNLEQYENINRLSPQDSSLLAEVAAAIADDLTEANADMTEAWLQWQGPQFVALGYLTTSELRWLNDSAEYGAVAKAWAGRNVARANTDAVPQQIATALAEWEARLTMLRTGAVLKRYYANESDADDSGVLEQQEGLGPVASFPCPPLCVDVSNNDCDCTCG